MNHFGISLQVFDVCGALHFLDMGLNGQCLLLGGAIYLQKNFPVLSAITELPGFRIFVKEHSFPEIGRAARVEPGELFGMENINTMDHRKKEKARHLKSIAGPFLLLLLGSNQPR